MAEILCIFIVVVLTGQFLMNAYILRELTSIQSKLNNLEQRQGRLEARVCSVSIDQNSSNTQFPVFTSLLQYSEVAKHPKDMVNFFNSFIIMPVYLCCV